MYTVSNEFKEMVKSNAVIATARITLVADGTVLDGNNLSSVSIRDYCNNNGTIIGTTMCKEAEIEIINNGYDLADKEFLLEVGVEVAEDTIEYIPYGNFVVKEYTDMKSNNRYKIVAYDYMDKLNQEFTDNNTYPMTLQAFYEAFATQYGVQIETQTLPNQEFMIGEKPYFEGATGRTVLSAIAQMFGSFAKFNRNNKLQMYLKNETDETIDRDQMNSKLEIDNRYGPINTVVLRLGQVEGENVTLKDEELIKSPSGKNKLMLDKVSPSGTTHNEIEPTINNGIINVKGKNNPDYSDRASYYNGYVEIYDTTEDWVENKTYYVSMKIDVLDNPRQIDTSYFPCFLFGNGTNSGRLIYNANTGKYEGKITTQSTISNSDKEKHYIEIRIGSCELNISEIMVSDEYLGTYEPYKPLGEVTLEIVDNPFIYTEELRYLAIQGIYDRVLGFTYIPTSFNYKSYLYLDCGDAVNVQNMDNDGYVDTIILNQEIKVPATRQSKCENLALTKTEVTNQYISPERQAQRKTELLVDKQNQKIEGLITKTDGQGQQITKISADLSGVTTRVSSTEEKIADVEKDLADTNSDISDLDDRVSREVENLQGQIDGSIQFWNGAEIPTLNNEPAVNWQTEIDRNNHRTDIYTVIEDIDGELKQGKSYRFDKVGTQWTWVELTDNELSAVQALAESKAKVFVSTPKTPYKIGDLWINNKEIYECIKDKSASEYFLESDWQKATKYTDDTLAELAKITADKAIYEQTITATTEESKSLYLPDSANDYCKSAEIFGESTQETRSGINKLNITDFSKTSDKGTTTTAKEGVLSFNGTPSAFDYKAILQAGYQPILPAGTYTLWLGDMQADCYYQTYNADGTVKDQEIYFYYGKNATKITSEYAFKMTGINLYFNANISYDGKTISPMLLNGTYTSSTIPAFEQYGQKPSPEFPSEIMSVSGKNILYWTRPTFVPVIENADGSFYFNYGYAYNLMMELTGELQAGTYTITNYGDIVLYVQAATDDYTLSATANGGTRTFTYDGTSYLRLLYGATTPNTSQLFKVQLEKDSQATFYVPYNHIGFKSIGKNISKNEALLLGNPIYPDNSQNNYFYIDISNLKVGDTLTLSFKSSRTDNIPFYAYPNSNLTGSAIWVCTATTDGTIYKATFTISEEILTNLTNAQGLLTSYVEAGRFTDTSELMAEKNTLVTEYQPYKESITSIPLLHDMRSLPNGVRDRIYHNNGKWYDEQRVKTTLLPNNIGGYNSDFDWYYLGFVGLEISVNPTTLLSNYFKYYTNRDFAYNYKTNEGISLQATTLQIRIAGLTSASEYRTWLGEHDVEVIYELAEPIVTEITDEATIAALESIRTFKGVTNIEADAPSILTYYRNVPIVEEYETKASAEKQYKVTQEKFAEQEVTNDQIKSSVTAINTTLSENYTTKEELNTQITQTSDTIMLSVNRSIQDLKDNGIPKVSGKIVSIDDNGLTVGAVEGGTESQFTNTMNNEGNYQYNAGVLIAKYDKDGAEIPRLKSDYTVVGGIKTTREEVGGIVHHRTYVLE